MDRQTLIRRVGAALADDPHTLAVFLTGSIGRGEADEFSDADFLVIMDAEYRGAFADRWPGVRDSLCPIIFEMTRTFDTFALFNHITRDWIRYDITVGGKGFLEGRSQSTLVPVYDPDDMYSSLPRNRPLTQPSARVVSAIVPEFYRVLSLLPVVLGREDYVVGMQGATLLHSMLIQAVTETVAVEDRGGALHLRRLLPEKLYDIAAGVPSILATRESVIRVHKYCAEQFMPVARRLCLATEVQWPEGFVGPVIEHVQPYFDEAP